MYFKVNFTEKQEKFNCRFNDTIIVKPNIKPGEFNKNGVYDAMDIAAIGYNPVVVNVDTETLYNKGFEDGVNSVPVYYATNLSFSEAAFPENYNFVLKVRKLYGLNNMFLRATTVKSIKIISDINNNTSDYQAAFREATALETVDLTECNRNIKSVAYMCLSASALKSIYGALNFTNCTNTTIWLNGASKLEDIEFVPDTIKISLSFQWCPKLSKESITSAINGLDNAVTGQTVTFRKTAVNNAFGINVDDESTYTEEFVALRESKNNWIFAYAII